MNWAREEADVKRRKTPSPFQDQMTGWRRRLRVWRMRPAEKMGLIYGCGSISTFETGAEDHGNDAITDALRLQTTASSSRWPSPKYCRLR